MRVWDRVVRTTHWTLAAAVALAWCSTLGWGLAHWHEPAGYAAAAVVLVRVVWGFVGSRHARFCQFVRPPGEVLEHLRQLLARCDRPAVGHNPAGGWMVVALLAATGATALSGWLYTTDRYWGVDWLARLHAQLAWLLLALVVLHLGGVTVMSLRHRRNLVRAMFTGDQRTPGEPRA